MQDGLTIQCPQCGSSISLDETLAGPVIAQVRTEADKQVSAAKDEAERKIASLASKATALATKEKELANLEAQIQNYVYEALALQRNQIDNNQCEEMRKEIAQELEAEKSKALKFAAQLEA